MSNRYNASLLFAALMLTTITFAQSGAESTHNSTPTTPEVQGTAEAHGFRLDFVVKEGGVKPRSYTMLIQTPSRKSSVLRSSTKSPLKPGVSAGDRGFFPPLSQMTDVKIDVVNAVELQNRLSLGLRGEISSMAVSDTDGSKSKPTMRQIQWEQEVVVPFGKETVVYASDDAQIELTVTPIPTK